MVEVQLHSLTGLAQQIDARGHTLIADEPAEAGGADSGLRPFELLLSALGACTAMTVELYAQQKGWPLEGVDIGLHHEREERTLADGTRRRIEVIAKQIAFRGPLDEGQRTRLLEIAGRCPVHRALTGDVEISQTLVAPAAGA